MLSVLGLSDLGVAARVANVVGMALVVSKIVPGMPNRTCRFVLLFALGLAFSFSLNYFDVRLLEYHRTGWAWASITALGLAIWGTFLATGTPKVK